MKKLLVISPFTAYKSIKHAGGKIHYYYLSKIQNDYEITTISIAKENEKDEIKKSLIKTKQSYILYKSNTISFFNRIKHFFWQRNPFDKYSGFIDYDEITYLYKMSKQLKKHKYTPDIIILDWTQSIFLSQKIKTLFPKSKIICIEQDVTFLKYQRFFENSTNKFKKLINRIKYINIKKQELNSLGFANQIVTLNQKDTDLLQFELGENITIKTIVPYFDTYFNIQRKDITSNIIYFGAMSRPENYNSAIWFIKNVFPNLPENFKFIVIGNSPVKELLDLADDRIIVTGFIQDISPYLQSSLCFAAPIVMGAGIKIKILEAMSAGIPVLTNDIGIEGIPAKNGEEYLYCTTPVDLINQIKDLYNNPEKNFLIGNSARNFIKNNFNFENYSYI